jgi:sporulation protein YlmC with PRC-barrel domain
MANIRTSSTSTGTKVVGGSRRVLSAKTLQGDRVRNRQGEDLGTIKELMIDLENGRVAYAVLSFGGLFGMGDKLFAVPWSALTLDESTHEFLLNADRATLESAPGFDKDNWPDFADNSWGQQVYDYYGAKPYWESERVGRSTDRPDRTFRGGGGV